MSKDIRYRLVAWMHRHPRLWKSVVTLRCRSIETKCYQEYDKVDPTAEVNRLRTRTEVASPIRDLK